MGPPGSGKSTLARQLGARFGLPVFHLDQAYWQPGWTETPIDLFEAEVERLAGLAAWVIDGNYTGTIGPRFAAADTVIYLDVPSWVSMLRLLRRTSVSYGDVREDAAPGCRAVRPGLLALRMDLESRAAIAKPRTGRELSRP